MAFTTQVFLFIFFPICIFSYFIADRLECAGKRVGCFFKKIRIRDLTLIAMSLGFYAWSCFDDLFRLLGYITVVYCLGLFISASLKKGYYIDLKKDSSVEESGKRIKTAVIPCVLAVSALIAYLVYHRYSSEIVKIWNKIFTIELEFQPIFTLLGISFITFSSISYLVDIYRGKATSGSWIDCALYISFFPKVVSGPIILWQDFQGQIKTRKSTLNCNIEGINRIIIGFAKKVILADTFGACIQDIGTSNIDRITAIGTLLLYMLQIYYDFAGYSDIAIGLCKLFGFDVKENFNFPYRSKSISEFWRRWHISLGTWFREYVYYPMGGSRAGFLKTLRNLSIVFLLTGIWHGAGLNYLLWGVLNGAIVLVERILQDTKLYKKIPSFIKYGFTMFAVLMLWQLFRFQKLSDLSAFFGIMNGTVTFDSIYYSWQHFFDARMITFVIIGVLGATVLGSKHCKKVYDKVVATKVGFAVQEVLLLVLFVIAILFIVNSTYSPFIYFQY